MTLKDKIILIILSVITIGIYPIIIFKKKQVATNTKLSSKKVSINVNLLREYLGGSENIAGVEYTHTKIKFLLKNSSKIKIDKIQKINGISGLFNTSKSITIIVGNQAKELATLF